MRYTVIGAGHGGQALAGYIASKGYTTTLYNRNEPVIREIQKNKGINVIGYVNKKVENIFLTSNIQEALTKTDIIMICIPANAHEDLAKNMAPYITDKHIIVINPGRTLGAYYFKKNLFKYGSKCSPIIAETDTFILTSRKIQNGCSEIMSLKNEVYLASDNKENTSIVTKCLSDVFPMIKSANSSIYTSFSNIGSIFHPIPAIFNIGRIENKDEYLHYKEGITPSICNLMEKLDFERVKLAERLGESVPSAKEWLNNVYGSQGESLYEALQNTEAYGRVLAPTEISTRYIYEDICTGIVPMYCLAKKLNTPCTILTSVIQLATQMFNYNFIDNGINEVDGFIEEMFNKI